MLGAEETGYLTDNNDDEQYNKIESSKQVVPVSGDQLTDKGYEIDEQKYKQNINHLRSGSGTLSEPPLRCFSSFVREKNEKRVPLPPFGSIRIRKRSNSISAIGNCGVLINGSTPPPTMPRYHLFVQTGASSECLYILLVTPL
ncbi:hypothetical protein K7X08_031972 [Anisodus acutangulus]|uniref:Uncharacterized protein n=1 Tax=Anisodus acutangulus TaxID=402998 RepID=A0A9Q1MM45_9SOLA|nr:hypothetical protein K7X08_031972 [Anisodus acutangulus]